MKMAVQATKMTDELESREEQLQSEQRKLRGLNSETWPISASAFFLKKTLRLVIISLYKSF